MWTMEMCRQIWGEKIVTHSQEASFYWLQWAKLEAMQTINISKHSSQLVLESWLLFLPELVIHETQIKILSSIPSMHMCFLQV